MKATDHSMALFNLSKIDTKASTWDPNKSDGMITNNLFWLPKIHNLSNKESL